MPTSRWPTWRRRKPFAWFVGARLTNANLQETKFNATNLRNANLEGAYRATPSSPIADFEGCTGCPTDW
jgi:uncharacterized protein YjbI with pentapeptide repeats